MNRRELVKPEYRSVDGESWPQYLRRVWPDLADTMLLDPAARARELADGWRAEQLYFARQSFDICRGLPTWTEVVAAFLASKQTRRDLGTLISDMEHALEYIGEFVEELRDRYEAGETLNDEETDAVLSLYASLGAGEPDDDGEAA